MDDTLDILRRRIENLENRMSALEKMTRPPHTEVQHREFSDYEKNEIERILMENQRYGPIDKKKLEVTYKPLKIGDSR